LIIDVDNINFVDNPEDLGIILNKIDAELKDCFNTKLLPKIKKNKLPIKKLFEAFYFKYLFLSIIGN
jgi:hypothetical protein